MGRYPKGYWLNDFPQYNFIISGDTGLQVSDVLSDRRRTQKGGDHLCFMYQLESVLVQHHSRCFCKRGVCCSVYMCEVVVCRFQRLMSGVFYFIVWHSVFHWTLNSLTNLTKLAYQQTPGFLLSVFTVLVFLAYPITPGFWRASGGWIQVLMLAVLYRLSDFLSSSEVF